MAIGYTIRYRCRVGSRVTLIVDDPEGVAYLFRGGGFRRRLTGPDASERLARWWGKWFVCVPVPPVAPYSLDDLRRLTEAPVLHRAALEPACATSSPGGARWETSMISPSSAAARRG